MAVARDVVRRRIDPGGTKEITVVTEGANRVLVEVPGVENPDELKALIGQTARLEFKLVDLSANAADVSAAPISRSASSSAKTHPAERSFVTVTARSCAVTETGMAPFGRPVGGSQSAGPRVLIAQTGSRHVRPLCRGAMAGPG